VYSVSDYASEYDTDYTTEYSTDLIYGASSGLEAPYVRVETWTLYVRAA